MRNAPGGLSPRYVIRGYTVVARSEKSKAALPKDSANQENFQPAEFELVDAGVDWITVTCKDTLRREQLQVCGTSHIEVCASRGEKVVPWSFQGYQGLSAGEASFGTREEDSILRLSGPTAFSHWRRAYELADNCSRIDLQMTVRTTDDVPQLVEWYHEAAGEHYKNWKRKPEVDLWRSNNGSDTLYICKRVSEQFCRVYDKGVESKLDHYRNCVRFEVEYKGKCAKLVAMKLSQDENPNARAIELCSAFLMAHGLKPPLPSTPRHVIRVPRSRSTSLKRLAWLCAAVRPSIALLIKDGKLSEVIEALGLMDHVKVSVGPRE
jgi:DNA relaxase NicK